LKIKKLIDYLFWPILITLGITTILAVPIEIFNDVDVWSSFKISDVGANKEFCEFHGYDRLIRQPVNTWSNMVYLFLSVIFFRYAYKDSQDKIVNRHNFVTRYSSYSIVLGVVMVFLSSASFLFHASLIEFARKLDITGVVASAMVLFSYSSLRLYGLMDFRKSELMFLRTYKLHILSIVFGLIAFFLSGVNGREVTGILISLIILINLYTQVRYRPIQKERVKIWYLLGGILSIIISVSVWVLDKDLLCNPTSLIQLHAVWHILTGLSIYLMYMFYRTELLFKHHLPKLDIVENS